MTRTIIGKRGTGKTTLAKKFITYRSKPVIVLDLFDQFKGDRFFSSRNLLKHILINNISISRPLIISIYDASEFHILCEIAVRLKNIMLVVDEVDFYDSPFSQDPSFKKIIHYGRHYNIDLVTTSRRPANISRDLTSQTDEFYIFKVTEKRDLDYFSFLNADLPDLIRSLKPFHFLKYDHINVETFPPLSSIS